MLERGCGNGLLSNLTFPPIEVPERDGRTQMSNITTTDPSGTEVHRAYHARAAYGAEIADCRAIIEKRIGLHYAAHVTCGVFDYALENPSDWPPATDLARDLERASRQLNLAFTQLDATCELLDSGVLIRMVMQGESGALFQFVKVSGQSFIGMTRDGRQAAVDGVDRELASLALIASRRVGAVSLEWGGFRQRAESGDLLGPYEVSSAELAGQPRVHATIYGKIPAGIADAGLAALDPGDVHFVAIYHRRHLVWSADIFEDPAVAPLFQRVTATDRRRGYDRIVRQLDLQDGRIRRLLAAVHGDQLVRLVLDLARGAIYVMPLADGGRLVAVTLLQSQVDVADGKVRSLHSLVDRLWPGEQVIARSA
jgi:hypothetical protein